MKVFIVRLLLFLHLVSILLAIFILDQLGLNTLIFGKSEYTSTNRIIAAGNDTRKDITICCSWNKNMTSKIITYSTVNASGTVKNAIQSGLDEWSKSKVIKFIEIPDSNNADVKIRFVREAGAGALNHSNNELIMQSGLTVGKTVDTFDNEGYINHSNILIYGSAFGSLLDSQTIQNVAAHEIGHALGLGHANFNTDLMFNKVSYQKQVVSQCDIDGVLRANQIKLGYLMDDSNIQKSHTFTCNQ